MGERHRQARLSLKQQRFIDEFVASNGNGTQSCRLAGYQQDDNGLAVQAHDNLRKPKIKAAIEAKLADLAVDYGPDRVKRRLHEISHASQAAGQFGPAVRSEELLGKAAGMWIDQSLALTGVLNDSAVAALLDLAKRRQAEPVDLVDDQARDRSDS